MDTVHDWTARRAGAGMTITGVVVIDRFQTGARGETKKVRITNVERIYVNTDDGYVYAVDKTGAKTRLVTLTGMVS